MGHGKGVAFRGICLREEGYSSPKNIWSIVGIGRVDLGFSSVEHNPLGLHGKQKMIFKWTKI